MCVTCACNQEQCHSIPVEQLLRSWDLNRDNHIGKDELQRLLLELGYETPDAVLSALFDIFDKDGNQHIDHKELATVLRSLGQNPTDQEVNTMIADADFSSKQIYYLLITVF